MTDLEKQVQEKLIKLSESELFKVHQSKNEMEFSVQSSDHYVFSLSFHDEPIKLSNDSIWVSTALLSVARNQEDFNLLHSNLEDLETDGGKEVSGKSTHLLAHLAISPLCNVEVKTELMAGSEGLNKLNHALDICEASIRAVGSE